jgi:hypothetical protein
MLSRGGLLLREIFLRGGEHPVLLVCRPCAYGPMREKLIEISKVYKVIHDSGESPPSRH